MSGCSETNEMTIKKNNKKIKILYLQPRLIIGRAEEFRLTILKQKKIKEIFKK